MSEDKDGCHPDARPYPAIMADSKYFRMSREEEQQCFATIREDPASEAAARAIERITLSHLSFVAAWAHRYRDVAPPDDLIQEVLIKAVPAAIERFDPERGHRFVTYLRWRLRAVIGDAVRRHHYPDASSLDGPIRGGEQRFYRCTPHAGDFLSSAHEVVPSPDPTPEEAVMAQEEEAERLAQIDAVTCALDVLAREDPVGAFVVRLHFGIIGGHPHSLRQIAAVLRDSTEKEHTDLPGYSKDFVRYGIKDPAMKRLEAILRERGVRGAA